MWQHGFMGLMNNFKRGGGCGGGCERRGNTVFALPGRSVMIDARCGNMVSWGSKPNQIEVAGAAAAVRDMTTLRRPATLGELPASRLVLLYTDENKYRMT